MYNFLDPKLLPKVKCNAPATENFEATNLISEKEAVRNRGYLAYTVTAPPVELEFELLCYVDISSICLQTTVGRQRCTGIEVLVKKDDKPYINIGRAVYDTCGLTFCNSRRFSKSHPPPYHDPTNALFFFKTDTDRFFVDANFLKIVIFRTNRSVPCLRSVKVVGRPSRSCSRVTVNTIEKIMTPAPQGVFQIKTEKSDDVEIPEDFKDALTCEIMTVPMTLPSGKSVDRDTLEKHALNEKSFGREPCDPFTGLKFTETRKPVVNAALKSRIDMFLVQNSHKPFTYGLKRTVGSDGSSSKRYKNADSKDHKCCLCEDTEFLYALPCRHYYCRQCLLNLKILVCNSCDCEFSKSSVTRCHQ